MVEVGNIAAAIGRMRSSYTQARDIASCIRIRAIALTQHNSPLEY
jgi:hypothetical protein